MNWRALEFNECPKCGEPLGDCHDGMISCSESSCSFMISSDRMAELVDDLETEDSFSMYGPRDTL